MGSSSHASPRFWPSDFACCVSTESGRHESEPVLGLCNIALGNGVR